MKITSSGDGEIPEKCICGGWIQKSYDALWEAECPTCPLRYVKNYSSKGIGWAAFEEKR